MYIYIYNMYIYIYNMYICNNMYIYIYKLCKLWKQDLGYDHNDFLVTDGFLHMMFSYQLMVPMNQKISQQAKLRLDVFACHESPMSTYIFCSFLSLLCTLLVRLYQKYVVVHYVHDFPQCLCSDNQEGTPFSRFHIYTPQECLKHKSKNFDYSVISRVKAEHRNL